MSLKKILKKSLTPELFAQVEEELGEEYDQEYVPRTRLNAVIKQRNAYRDQLSSIGDADDDDEDDKEPTPKVKPAKKESTVTEADIQTRINAEVTKVQTQYAIREALREAKVKKPELLLPQLDLTKVELKDGKVTGLDEQITNWKTSDPYLFNIEDTTPPSGTGKDGGTNKEPPEDNMTDAEYYAKVFGK